jgi:hypothetical protein
MTGDTKFNIIRFGTNRYVISNSEGKIIDDANGYGYKTSKNAYLAMKYKYMGGKEKKDSQKNQFKEWLKTPTNKELIKKFEDTIEYGFKEIARGETTIKDIWNQLEKEYNLIVPDYVKKQFGR